MGLLLALAIIALILALLAAVGKMPLVAPVIVLCLIEVIEKLPAGGLKF